MKKSDINNIKQYLHTLLKMDYTVGIYNYNNNVITLSFNHLNSVYNALASAIIDKKQIIIDYQYSAKNKKVEKIIYKILNYCIDNYKSYSDIQALENEIIFYKNLAQAVYNSKYSLNTILHTINA